MINQQDLRWFFSDEMKQYCLTYFLVFNYCKEMFKKHFCTHIAQFLGLKNEVCIKEKKLFGLSLY